MRFFDKEGKEISMEEWSKLFEDMDYRRIALTVIDDAEVSTVLIGMTFNETPKDIFETMIFFKGKEDNPSMRSGSVKEAKYIHNVAVELVKISKEKSITNFKEILQLAVEENRHNA